MIANFIKTVLVTSIAVLGACEKTEEIKAVIAESDAAEIVAAIMAGEACGNASGRTIQASQRASTAMSWSNPCSFNRDTTYACSNTIGTVTYNYSLATKSYMTCQAIVPTAFTFMGTGTGNVAKSKIAHQTTLRDSFTVSGLQPASTQYLLQGTITVEGTGTLKNIAQTRTFNSKFSLTLTNMTVNKSPAVITGGTGQFTISGSSENKSYQFSGTIVFNGDETATLKIGNRTFTIHLKTGEVT